MPPAPHLWVSGQLPARCPQNLPRCPNDLTLQLRACPCSSVSFSPVVGCGRTRTQSPFLAAHLPWLRTRMSQTPGHLSTSGLPVSSSRAHSVRPSQPQPPLPGPGLLPCRFRLSLLCPQDVPQVLTCWPGLGRRPSACLPRPSPLRPAASPRPPRCPALPSPPGHSGVMPTPPRLPWGL